MVDPDAVLRLVRELLCPAGSLPRGDASLYRHLWRSVLDFDTAGAFRDRLVRAGLSPVRTAPVTGWQRGIVHTFLAGRPDGAEDGVGRDGDGDGPGEGAGPAPG
ncbi:hypothetical protein [Streptomyces xinghaiensis]|uniref:hypothetical protein n=1 Tax=Streptomyces xinghaiensis TaxID=1038928 RepID=UPI0006854674|nr:hypothetical protein [Streptomyces sp. SID5475]